MGVVVQYGRRKAFLRDGEWRSSDAELEERLNSVTEMWIQASGGPPLGAPDPERTAAETIAKKTGGRLILHVQARPKIDRQVWAARRQLSLPFVSSRE